MSNTTEKTEEIIAAYMDSDEANTDQINLAVERAIRRAFISGMQRGLDLAGKISKEVYSRD